ncbi:MAG: HAMP domain-containing sensor histidine kinase [Holophagae bacterium]|jgi:signal transduction histidine kinase
MADRDRTLDTDREWLVNQIAHALRNPIFAASVQGEALQLRADDPAAVVKALDSMRGQLQRLSSIIDEMLLFGRPVRPTLEDVDVADALDSVAARYRAGDRQAPAEVSVGPIAPGLVGFWDRQLVTIVLERLLDNAVQHTEPPHRIELTAAADTGVIVVAVRDAGRGIPPDILEQALLPFFPQHSGRAGLGLAVADKMVRAHGGRIELESIEGEGTTARYVLPVRANE